MNLLVLGWGYTCRAEITSCQGDDLKSALSRIQTDSACSQAIGGINRKTEICTKTSGISLGWWRQWRPGRHQHVGRPASRRGQQLGRDRPAERAVIGGWMGYAEVAGTELAIWVSATVTANN